MHDPFDYDTPDATLTADDVNKDAVKTAYKQSSDALLSRMDSYDYDLLHDTDIQVNDEWWTIESIDRQLTDDGVPLVTVGVSRPITLEDGISQDVEQTLTALDFQRLDHAFWASIVDDAEFID